ncbi:ABC transporter ATP-binding protein [Actinomyces sp. zg-332]|uniref:ABC transporter ATP-binding protein n=1 Tax=Actinomyces sp. zg-332 TaxID=2708340 RepID=UPI00141DCC0B|nr:ABC transporter ATP-binding protein [Actinomyces sp. zg-332]QPK93800.1 ABC transporter ATP-binding protein [Actinomyces sp. zg-332]
MSDVWKKTNNDSISENEIEQRRSSLQSSDVKSFEFNITEETIANSALCIKNLSKNFSGTYAVNNVSLVVPKGSFYGLVGPNGAGKTTTIAMIARLLKPNSGEIYIQGKDLSTDEDEIRNLIGVMPDGMRLFDRLTGLELLTYNGLLRGLPKDEIVERANELLKILDLDKENKKLVSDYSAGMTKKITLACAMIHAPSLLILDEPFEAVDPVSAKKIQLLLKQYIDNGGTIIFSSHVMATVEQLCTHVAIMNKGKVITAGSVEEVSDGISLEQRFIDSVGSSIEVEELNWLQH